MEFKEFLDRTVGCKRRDTITNSIAGSLKKEDISNIVLDEWKEKEITKVLLEDSNNSYQNIMVVLSSVCSAIALFISAVSMTISIGAMNICNSAKVVMMILTFILIVLIAASVVYGMCKTIKINDDNARIRNYLIGLMLYEKREDK